MYPMLFPITLEKSAKDQNGTEPVHLAKGQEGKKMEQGQIGLA